MIRRIAILALALTLALALAGCVRNDQPSDEQAANARTLHHDLATRLPGRVLLVRADPDGRLAVEGEGDFTKDEITAITRTVDASAATAHSAGIVLELYASHTVRDATDMNGVRYQKWEFAGLYHSEPLN